MNKKQTKKMAVLLIIAIFFSTLLQGNTGKIYVNASDEVTILRVALQDGFISEKSYNHERTTAFTGSGEVL